MVWLITKWFCFDLVQKDNCLIWPNLFSPGQQIIKCHLFRLVSNGQISIALFGLPWLTNYQMPICFVIICFCLAGKLPNVVCYKTEWDQSKILFSLGSKNNLASFTLALTQLQNTIWLSLVTKFIQLTHMFKLILI